jgi:hypothetical protein
MDEYDWAPFKRVRRFADSEIVFGDAPLDVVRDANVKGSVIAAYHVDDEVLHHLASASSKSCRLRVAGRLSGRPPSNAPTGPASRLVENACMKAPLVARILGILLFAIGIAGFVPFLTPAAGPTAEYVTIGANYGFLAGLFPVNIAHDVLNLIFGIWGVGASFAFAGSVRYCRWMTWIGAFAVVLGAIPITNTLFGIAPLYGHDIWLDALLTVVALYGGYVPGASTPDPDETFPSPPEAVA